MAVTRYFVLKRSLKHYTRCMSRFAFQTLDVFTDRRFGGNPLAVFPDARGLDAATMQSIAAELNLSETCFVLPPADPANDARLRIFNRTAEMPFAGHPTIGTAWVLARGGFIGDVLRMEVPAGIVEATLLRGADGAVTGAQIATPQPLSIGTQSDSALVAACIGLSPQDIIVTGHPPVEVSTGVAFVMVQVAPNRLADCVPDIAAFRVAMAAHDGTPDRYSLLVYARDGANLRARMFAPLSGTIEDAATGSANATLAALLLSIDGGDSAAFTTWQGIEMGRPSLLRLTARRAADGIRATVAGDCAPMFIGSWDDQTTG